MGAMPVLGYMGTSRIAVNQFGYTGGGFRRFFLLPTDPGAALRAASYASLLMGAGMIPLGLIAWIAFVPRGRDATRGLHAAVLSRYRIAGIQRHGPVVDALRPAQRQLYERRGERSFRGRQCGGIHLHAGRPFPAACY